MDAAESLDLIEQLFFTDRQQAMEQLSDLVEGTTGKRRAATMREIVRRVDHEHPGLGAYLALAGGALVESGEESGTLGRALIAPLVRALTAAARMLDHVAHLPDAELDETEEDEEEEGEGADGAHAHNGAHDHANGHGHDHDHDHDHGGDDDSDGDEDAHVLIGTKAVDRTMLDAIAETDLPAVQAWFSMDIWYRPAVATWTREPAILRDVQGNAELRESLGKLGGATETSHWLSLLIETVVDTRLVCVFPELGEAWQLTADGVVDMGQLSVLMSVALRDPLARVGVTEVASDEALAVMRGDGPQEADTSYACAFHCYAVEASDRDSGLPRDDVYTWRAPGGTGSHSLPSDFLPGTLAPVDGARVLVVVGPHSPGRRFVRVIPAVRTFDGLDARVSAATRLAPDEARRWADLAKSRGV